MRQARTIGNQCPVNNAAALADIPGEGQRAGWHVIEACGGPPSLHHQGEIVSYRLPIQPPRGAIVWPMFRGSPAHLGVADEGGLGAPVPLGP